MRHSLSFAFILSLLPLIWAIPTPQDGNNDGSDPGVLIGDLAKTGPMTPVGTSIANILLGTESAQSQVSGTPPSTSIAGCKSSTNPCCIWYLIAKDLTTAYKGPSGRCNDLARGAIRMGFHDAGTWSQALANNGQDFGGADGSFILFNEILRSENRGLEPNVALVQLLRLRYPTVGVADMIQYMAAHAVVTCPLGPRIRSFVGRKDATRASPDGLLPSVTSDANTLISLFQDKTISPHELAALLGAHSTSRQFFVDVKRFGQPQDSTPGVWDVGFYNETVQPVPKNGTFRFASDAVLSKDSRVSSEWNAFIGDQTHWNMDYAAAYTRLSLLGVNNINNLTECTATLPAARPSFPGSTEALIIQ
jgi:hypothetical protein